MRITKKQIKYLHDKSLSCTKEIIKEWFPDAFKTELEVGKWYKETSSKALIHIVDIGDISLVAYGFSTTGRWLTTQKCWDKEYRSYLVPASPQEVEAALIEEAKRRGFKEGVWFKHIGFDKHRQIHGSVYRHHSDDNTLRINGFALFSKGEWVCELIPTITKQEAEKQLNCKIV